MVPAPADNVGEGEALVLDHPPEPWTHRLAQWDRWIPVIRQGLQVCLLVGVELEGAGDGVQNLVRGVDITPLL